MRKEFIIAIISGIMIGVIVAFGIWRANKAFKPVDLTSLPEETQPQDKTEISSSTKLTIAQPEEDDVITSTPVKITGITKPNITFLISAEKEDYIVKTSSDGSFEQEVDLVGGVNEILLAYLEDGDNAQSKSLRVIYSSEFNKEVSE